MSEYKPITKGLRDYIRDKVLVRGEMHRIAKRLQLAEVADGSDSE